MEQTWLCKPACNNSSFLTVVLVKGFPGSCGTWARCNHISSLEEFQGNIPPYVKIRSTWSSRTSSSHPSGGSRGESPLRREGLSTELKSCYFQRKDPDRDHLNPRQGPWTMWSPCRTRGRWSRCGTRTQIRHLQSPPLSDKENRRAKELMSTSTPVSTPQRGRGRGTL